jgi:hypothetical protein
MNIPGFTAEISLYRTNNRYRFFGEGFQSDGDAAVTPQDCGIVKGGVCGTFIAAGLAVCTTACVVGAPTGIPCWVCWTGFLGGLYGFCRDCIPEWIRDILDAVEGGGGGGGGGGTGGGGGGGGGTPGRSCGCPSGTRCCGPCVKVPGQGLACEGGCLEPGESC